MTTKKYELTEEHRAQLGPWRAMWDANALRNNNPLTDEEKEVTRVALRGLYEAADLVPPAIEVFCDGPITGALAACFAAGVWWLRDNPEKHQELLGALLSEAQLQDAVRQACSIACTSGIKATRMEDASTSPSQKVTGLIDRATNATITAALAAIGSAGSTLTDTSQKNKKARDYCVDFLLSCCSHWARLRDNGNEWSGWVSYLSFFRHVAKLDLPIYEKFKHYEQATKAPPRFMHAKFWIVSAFPTMLKTEGENNRLHAASGPAKAWPDGFELHVWHGTRVPASWIEDKDSIKPEMALTWKNIEQRRAAAEIIGWDKILRLLKPEVIDTDPDPEIGVLLEVALPGSENPTRFLKVRCGTGRTFALPVPTEMKTALEANAWTYGLDGKDLKLEVRT